jgi:glucosamine--fructose-6-phosphate aminotransferase (isomerizing)
MPSTFTQNEILSQPAAWQNALDVTRTHAAALKALADHAGQVIFSGCGSTYYLSLAAAALFQELTGKPARGVPGSELLLNPQTVVSSGKTLLVAVSRSGTTTETIRAAEAFRAAGRGRVVVISNYPDTPLAKLADAALILPAGQEESVAQTRSFASMYVATTALACVSADREDSLDAMNRLPAVGERLLQHYAALAKEIGENLTFDRFYFLGSGIRYGLACEVNLKMKEMTLTHSEPFHFLEFRHGPMSMVTPGTVMVGLLSEKNRAHESAVLEEMRSKGAAILSVGESAADVCFSSAIPEALRGVLYLPVLQLAACSRAQAKGLNPDRPANLSAVIYLNL